MEKLGIDLSTILIQIVNFGILVFVLNKFMYKPVIKAIKAKKAELDEIETGKAKLSANEGKIEVEREKIVKAAQNEKRELLQNAKSEAEANKKVVLEKAKKEAKVILEKARKEVAAEKEKLARTYEKDVTDAAFALSEKVIGKLVEKKSLEKAMKDLGSVKSALWKN